MYFLTFLFSLSGKKSVLLIMCFIYIFFFFAFVVVQLSLFSPRDNFIPPIQIILQLKTSAKTSGLES